MDTVKKEIIKSIIRECFWEYTFSPQDIERIVSSGTFAEKMFLFQKILANSMNVIRALKIFSTGDLKKLLESYKVPRFNYDFLKKRKDIVEFFFNREVDIPTLRWSVK